MPRDDDQSKDAYLNDIRNNTEEIVICSGLPADFAGVAAVRLGGKTSPTIGAPQDGDVNGRKITLSAITDGTTTATGTATHVAWVDNTNSRLKWAEPLAASQAVTSGNPWTLTAMDIELPDPA